MTDVFATAAPGVTIRFAREDETPMILRMIRELAEYERMSDQVVATAEGLRMWLFEKKTAEVVFAVCDGEVVGMALFFHNFSTFMGCAGIYLEDLYVLPAARGCGAGKALLAFLGRLCVERGCGRLDWACLDWNEPSIRFYKSLGAVAMDDWTGYRVSGDALDGLAALGTA